jgi:hypothetical protein
LLGSLWFNSFSAGGGAAADYELISTTVLSSSAASVTFSGLGTSAAAYKHLQIRVTARSTNGGAGNDGLWLQFNGDTGSNYAWHRLEGNGSSVSSGAGSSTTWMLQGLAARASQASGVFSAALIDILDFANTSKNTTSRSLNGSMTSTNPSVALGSGVWLNTAAVTSATLKPDAGYDFLTGSRFSLYGLRG